MFKKCTLIVLPTNSFSVLGRYVDTDRYVFNGPTDIPRGKFYHLYVLSNDKIQVGDPCLDMEDPNDIFPYQSIDTEEDHWSNKKIIATTNPFLTVGRTFYSKSLCPKIPNSFIHSLITRLNTGIIIDSVMVEYNEYNCSTTWEFDEPEISELKLDSDNAVSLAFNKSLWTREEVDMLFNNLLNDVLIKDKFNSIYKSNLCKNPNSNKIAEYLINWEKTNL